jgi:hypothetical protein
MFPLPYPFDFASFIIERNVRFRPPYIEPFGFKAPPQRGFLFSAAVEGLINRSAYLLKASVEGLPLSLVPVSATPNELHEPRSPGVSHQAQQRFHVQVERK